MEELIRLKKRATAIKYTYITFSIVLVLILLRNRHFIGDIKIPNIDLMVIIIVMFLLPFIYFLIDARIRSKYYEPRGFTVLYGRSKKKRYLMSIILLTLFIGEFLLLYFDYYRNTGPAIGISFVLLYQLISEKVYVNKSRFSVKYFEGEIKYINAIRKSYGVNIVLNYKDKDMQLSLPNKYARDRLFEYITESDEFKGIVYS
ncbi:hypothetical protein EZV73_01470 [Acidaminobacter sp. JC074]|uniref:hypothetical protein n=1 Tax=Acidaminobacter sp. JC074 TaxID=2530199 RepID=UPI001F115A23|nr:hypothetical protein [Acidaminobacter sp. JC074]MCH4886213.1 hypothetical protein [Acidaminobacter sp. JC074]